MENFPTKSQLLGAIHQDYQHLKETLAKLNDTEIIQKKIGEWTIKDIIAHIAWHEKEMIGLLEAHALVGSPWWNLPTDERNRLIFEENKDRSLDDIRREAGLAHTQMVALLEALPEADLYDPSGFPNMPPDWQPCDVIIQNTYEHYQAHVEDIRLFLLKR